ncbi:hypothetical protein [Novipirellula caenicola]
MSRISLLLFAVFLSAGAVASSSAQGSCGDWLAHSGDTATTTDGVQNDVSVEKSERVSDQSNSHESRARRCRGLHCEQAPLGPAPLPASPINDQRLPDLACLMALPNSDDFEIVGGMAESKIGLLVGNAITIERPPKHRPLCHG